jgi:hypothetical protein
VNPRHQLLAFAMMMLPGFISLARKLRSQIVEGKRKEGRIVRYTTMSLDQSKEFMARFQKKYPFLRRSVFHSAGRALLNRVVSESKADRNLFNKVHGHREIVSPAKHESCRAIMHHCLVPVLNNTPWLRAGRASLT